jgi:peptidyl-tRNA hydrolase
MYLVVRKSLHLSPGKLAVQTSHAVQYAVEDFSFLNEPTDFSPPGEAEVKALCETYRLWNGAGRHRKVLLGANEKDWEKVKAEKARHYLVTDDGLTETAPNTETMVAFWPMRKSEASKVLSRLQAIKAPTLAESLEIIHGSPFGAVGEFVVANVLSGLYHQFIHDVANAVLEWKERGHDRRAEEDRNAEGHAG